MDVLVLPSLQDSGREKIELPFNEDEVTRAVLDCHEDKGPQPAGITIALLQTNWDTFKIDVIRMFCEFFSSGRFVSSLNATFVCLILKKGKVEDISDFRRISFVGCIYKLLSKVLANRMKGVIEDLISGNQNSFLGGCQILDVMRCFWQMSSFDSRVKSGDTDVSCKLDIDKACDHVNLDFLIYCNEENGFCE